MVKKAESKKVEKVVEVEKPVEKPVVPTSNITFHKERWDNDSGTNQLLAEKLPSLND